MIDKWAKMDKRKLKVFREKLLAKQAELTRGFERNKSVTSDSQSSGSEDFVDYAVNAYTKEFLLSLSDIDRRSLVLVDAALARIRSGDYATCLECGTVIGEKRLQAVPWTPYCISCQEKQEQESSRSVSPQSRFPVD